MKKNILILCFLCCYSVLYAQKQATPYFEFTYDCTAVNTDYNSQSDSWSYEYKDQKNDLFITIDVKINPRGEDYPQGLIDGLVTDLTYIKTSIGTFQKLYGAISIGESQGYYLRKATFIAKTRMYIVSVISSDKDLVYRVYNQLEQSFVILFEIRSASNAITGNNKQRKWQADGVSADELATEGYGGGQDMIGKSGFIENKQELDRLGIPTGLDVDMSGMAQQMASAQSTTERLTNSWVFSRVIIVGMSLIIIVILLFLIKRKKN